MTFRVVMTNQYNQDLRLIHSTNGNHLESPKEGSSIDHQVTIYLHAQNITMFPTNETWEHCDVMSMQMDSDLVIYRTTLVRTFQMVTICRVDKSEALSAIPRGSWGDVARRFTMIRWANQEFGRPSSQTSRTAAAHHRASVVPPPSVRRVIGLVSINATRSFRPCQNPSDLLVQIDGGILIPVVDLIRRIYRRLQFKSQISLRILVGARRPDASKIRPKNGLKRTSKRCSEAGEDLV
ncbi:hypothetical protein F511_20254 [Dorcoceras hygrometricum]|uniref:Uncharacterized protein n=1 Tax=Dorcoceras hygrometricum TaxID=472368 RepID=A0A2Z7BCJ8_9LAMI|nr:hypothetical protein F511_20254 [Dorcoceras hygrometricum]